VLASGSGREPQTRLSGRLALRAHDRCQPNEGQYYTDYQQSDLLRAKRSILKPQGMGEYRDEDGHHSDKNQDALRLGKRPQKSDSRGQPGTPGIPGGSGTAIVALPSRLPADPAPHAGEGKGSSRDPEQGVL
jgi:hypothetical protein